MTKKIEKTKEKTVNHLGQTVMSNEMYWQWRTEVGEVLLMREKLSSAKWQAKMHKEKGRADIAESKLAVINAIDKVNTLTESLKETEKYYSKYKSSIEKQLGISLKNCTIDDETHAIIPLPDDGKDANG